MSPVKGNKSRGYFAFAASGSALGFFVGILFLSKLDAGEGATFLLECTFLGLIGGIVLAVLINRRYKFNQWYVPPYRSPDLDNFQDIYTDPKKDDNLLALLPGLTSEELLVALSYQYNDLLENSRFRIINELKRRNFSILSIRGLYDTTINDDRRVKQGCPRCGYKGYLEEAPNDEVNCLLCGYSDALDRKNSFVNKLKTFLGYYNDRRLSWRELETLLINES